MSANQSGFQDILSQRSGDAPKPDAPTDEPLLGKGEDAMDAIQKLSPALASELNKGYGIPDLMRLIRTKHPETPELLKMLILLQLADPRLRFDIEKADGLNVLADILRYEGETDRLNAIRILGGMAVDPALRGRIAGTDIVQRSMKQLMEATSTEAILSLLMAIRNFAGHARAAQEICETPQVFRRLSEFLNPKRFNEAVNENCAGLVANLARESSFFSANPLEAPPSNSLLCSGPKDRDCPQWNRGFVGFSTGLDISRNYQSRDTGTL